MRKVLAAVAAIAASALLAYGAAVPLIPTLPPYNDPSQTIATLNALIQQLNGQTGYAPPQVISLGVSGTASGPTPVTLNAQHGVVSFTGVGTLITGAVTTLTMNNSMITAASQCFAQIEAGGAAGSGPYISTANAAAGSVAFILGNAGTTATGAAQTFAINFTCI